MAGLLVRFRLPVAVLLCATVFGGIAMQTVRRAEAAMIPQLISDIRSDAIRVGGATITFDDIAEVVNTDVITLYAPAGWVFSAQPTVGPIPPADIVVSLASALGTVSADGTKAYITFIATNSPNSSVNVNSLPLLRTSGSGALNGVQFSISGIGRAAGQSGTLTGITPRSSSSSSSVSPSTAAMPGTLASNPVYSTGGQAAVVFNGGSVAQLDAALIRNGAAGAWAQDVLGNFVLYVVGGGAVNNGFAAAFPYGFPAATALTLIGK